MARKRTVKDGLDPVETFVERGQFAPAVAALLPALEQRAKAGDRACALAARLLRLSPMAEAATPRPPDALAATLQRLLALASRQEEQMRLLREMVEDEL